MKKITLVDVWAGWCGPCKRFAPLFQKLADEYPDIDFVKIDADTNHEFLAQWSIKGIPTIMAFIEEEPVFSHAGILSEVAMQDLISRLRISASAE